jgi:WXXGXW repeat (2 copies)
MERFYRFPLALLAIAVILAAVPQRSDAQVFAGAGVSLNVGVSVDLAPPALPVYAQPPAPYANAIWQPGYWAWGPYGYYWVPGTWVRPGQIGYLWTPGYWGFASGLYVWHPGYWGPHVGFYGGINYGYGYFGSGFVGGVWAGNVFRYNTAVVNVNTTVIRNVYVDRTVIVNNDATNVTRVSYNGGVGGIRAYPSAQERAYSNEPHLTMTTEQRAHTQVSQQNRNYLSTVNAGRPSDAAATRPLTRENLPESFNRVNAADRANASAMRAHVQQPPQRQYRAQPNGQAAHPRETGRPHNH